MVTFSVWFIIQSRIAFGGITAVFMALLAMWLLVAALQSRRTWVAVVAGIALGLGLYTFKTFLLYYLGIWGFVLLSLALNREFAAKAVSVGLPRSIPGSGRPDAALLRHFGLCRPET